MRYAFMLAATIWLTLASDAKAVTLTLPDGTAPPAPYQQWINHAKIPIPDMAIRLGLGTCPGLPAHSGCTWPGGPIWIDPTWGTDADRHIALLHELGHQFDYIVLNDSQRDTFRRLVGETRPWHDEGGNSPNEKFAVAWSICAKTTSLQRAQWLMGDYNYIVSRKRHRRICLLLQRASLLFSYGQLAHQQNDILHQSQDELAESHLHHATE